MKPVETRLATLRLSLVPVTPSDLGELHALYTDPIVRRHLWDDLVVDQLDTDHTIRQSLRSFRAYQYGLWRVQRHGETTLLGCCGLREVGAEAELVAAIEPREQRRGYAREACLAVLAHALKTLRLRRVVAMCDPANVAGRGLVHALGMREQHVTRASALGGQTVDVVVYELAAGGLAGVSR